MITINAGQSTSFPRIADAFAITSRYSDFELGILKYDAIVYYISVSFLFVFLTVQIIKKKRFN